MSEDYTVYDYDYDEESVVEEVEVANPGDAVVDEPAPVRETSEPAAEMVEFKMIRALRWYDQQLEAGETYTWPEDEFEALMYWVNLRTDRLPRVVRL